MTMYERIRQLRLDAGMSQDDLARAVGYAGRDMISKIEKGKIDISGKKICEFARALHTTPLYLLNGDESEPAPEPEPKIPQIAILSRGMENLTEDQRTMLLNVAKTMFPIAFGKELEEK